MSVKDTLDKIQRLPKDKQIGLIQSSGGFGFSITHGEKPLTSTDLKTVAAAYERMRTALECYAEPSNWIESGNVDKDGQPFLNVLEIFEGESINGYSVARAALEEN